MHYIYRFNESVFTHSFFIVIFLLFSASLLAVCDNTSISINTHTHTLKMKGLQRSIYEPAKQTAPLYYSNQYSCESFHPVWTNHLWTHRPLAEPHKYRRRVLGLMLAAETPLIYLKERQTKRERERGRDGSSPSVYAIFRGLIILIPGFHDVGWWHAPRPGTPAFCLPVKCEN